MIKILFFALLVKPIVFIVLGLNIRNRYQLPENGPAIIVANHNSHLDTLVLMSLYPLSTIRQIRPVAAVDYFYRNRFSTWIADNCIGIIALQRHKRCAKDKLFAGCHQALDKHEILIIFPEGSRGHPEEMSTLKSGVFHLVADRRTATPVIPVVMHGLGRSLPKGEALLVPFNCDVIVGSPLPQFDSPKKGIMRLESEFTSLFEQCLTKTHNTKLSQQQEGK